MAPRKKGKTTRDLKKRGPAKETRDWRSLPDGVIHRIASSFNSLPDFYSFRNTCPTWRSVAIPSAETFTSQSPIVLLPLETYSNKPVKAFMDLSTKKLHKVPPFLSWGNRTLLNFSNGYLAMGEDNGRVLLRHIITRDVIVLPRSSRDLTSSNLIFLDKPSSAECIFVLFQPCVETFEFCRKGDRQWNVLQFGDFKIMSMVFFQGRLYALLTQRGAFANQKYLAIVDLFPRPKIDFFSRPEICMDQYFMVRSGEQLLLSSSRGSYERWDMEGKCWIGTNSLGGRAVFISGSQITASEDPALVYGIEPDFSYIYNADHDIFAGTSKVNQSRWTLQLDFDDLINESADCQSGRPVWVFPSQCF